MEAGILSLKEKDDIHTINLGDCGYGSIFDNFRTKVQLCDECFNKSQKDKPIWSMDIVYGTMSNESQCKKYGLYSPEVKSSYAERFPVCQHPVHIIYNDGSHGCHCPFGAFGKYENGKVITNHISSDCYKCKYYKERIGTILTVHDKDMPEYELYIKYQLNKDKLEQKFSGMLSSMILI